MMMTARSSSIALQLVERCDAVEARHHDVDDRRIERQRPRQLETLLAG